MLSRHRSWFATWTVLALFAPAGARAADDPKPPAAGQDMPELMVQIGHATYLSRVAVSPDGKWLLTVGTDTTPRLWDLESGKLLRVFSGHSSWVTAATFLSSGKRVLTGGFDKTL